MISETQCIALFWKLIWVSISSIYSTWIFGRIWIVVMFSIRLLIFGHYVLGDAWNLIYWLSACTFETPISCHEYCLETRIFPQHRSNIQVSVDGNYGLRSSALLVIQLVDENFFTGSNLNLICYHGLHCFKVPSRRKFEWRWLRSFYFSISRFEKQHNFSLKVRNKTENRRFLVFTIHTWTFIWMNWMKIWLIWTRNEKKNA